MANTFCHQGTKTLRITKIVYKRYIKSSHDFTIDKELLNYLSKTCFLNEAASLIEKQRRNELEEAILKAIYWFGQVQDDTNDASKWIKLWTCLECFFSLDKNEITESNARGIASLLIYGGYKIDDFGDFMKLKSKIKIFYEFRSKIIHNADFKQIDSKSLYDLSLITAWVIIVAVSLLPSGATK